MWKLYQWHQKHSFDIPADAIQGTITEQVGAAEFVLQLIYNATVDKSYGQQIK
jgi:hypothetical protein